jgi:hypothetical protein
LLTQAPSLPLPVVSLKLPIAPSVSWMTRIACLLQAISCDLRLFRSQRTTVSTIKWNSVARWVALSKKLLEQALEEACQHGLSACDAIHITAARRGKCIDFVTAEKRTKPLFRVPGINVVSLQS